MPDIAQLLIGAVIVVFLLFAFVVFFGAPYLPSLSPQIEEGLDLLGLQPGQTMLELGSGDGRVLFAAAERGLNAIGYELNPLLVLWTRVRARKYKGRVRVYCRNFWSIDWPQTDGIFVFLLDKYMKKLDKKIIQEYSYPVKLVSFAFKIPGRPVAAHTKGVYLYTYNTRPAHKQRAS